MVYKKAWGTVWHQPESAGPIKTSLMQTICHNRAISCQDKFVSSTYCHSALLERKHITLTAAQQYIYYAYVIDCLTELESHGSTKSF